MNKTNIIYVFFWAVVSFIATFLYVLDGDWSQLIETDLLKGVLCPLLVWIVAFFSDYLYNIFNMNKDTQILSPEWTKASYFIIELLFIDLIASAYWVSSIGRTIYIIILFLLMMRLKTASLYVVRPNIKVERI